MAKASLTWSVCGHDAELTEELLELVESTSEEEEEVGDGENKEKQQEGLTLSHWRL